MPLAMSKRSGTAPSKWFLCWGGVACSDPRKSTYPCFGQILECKAAGKRTHWVRNWSEKAASANKANIAGRASCRRKVVLSSCPCFQQVSALMPPQRELSLCMGPKRASTSTSYQPSNCAAITVVKMLFWRPRLGMQNLPHLRTCRPNTQ